MPYDRTKDPYRDELADLNSIGRAGRELAASNDDLATYAKVTVIGEGQITILPAKNDDSDTLTFTPPSGWISPWLVRRVTAIGGTAKVVTVEG